MKPLEVVAVRGLHNAVDMLPYVVLVLVGSTETKQKYVSVKFIDVNDNK